MKDLKEAAKIAVTVVTHNRKDLLIDCLNGILKQSRPVDRIFVVDNASTDGTPETMKNMFGNNPLISYTLLEKNMGSAGGFYEGVKFAYDGGADWVWFLDDDVMPRPDCLEVLLKYQHIAKCINPNKVNTSTNEEFMGELLYEPTIGRIAFLQNISFKNGKDFAFMNLGCFEGMLLHRDIIAQIGFPDKRFFIYGDDTAYSFAASFYTNIILVKNAVLEKKIAFKNTATRLFSYYAIRNQFLMKEYVKKYNLLNPYFFNFGLAIFAFTASTKQAWRSRDFAIPWYVLRGLIDGMRGKFYEMGGSPYK